MIHTVTYYRFPFKEELGAWVIIWDELGGSEGYCHLKATIIPNAKILIKKLIKDHLLSERKSEIAYNHFTSPYGINEPPELLQYTLFSPQDGSDIYSVNVVIHILKFCETKVKEVKKKSFSWLAALDLGGNTTRSDKCMKAIKKGLTLDGEETLYKELKAYLSSNNVALHFVEPECPRVKCGSF